MLPKTLNVTQNIKYVFHGAEIIVGKGENVGNQKQALKETWLEKK